MSMDIDTVSMLFVQVQGHGMMGGGQNTRNWESYDYVNHR